MLGFLPWDPCQKVEPPCREDGRLRAGVAPAAPLSLISKQNSAGRHNQKSVGVRKIANARVSQRAGQRIDVVYFTSL